MDLIRKLEGSDFAPNFVARDNFPELNLRGYVHGAGLDHAYGNDPDQALAHIEWIYEDWNRFQEIGHQYAIALAWGFEKDKMVDFFLYGDLDVSNSPEKWKTVNPDKTTIVTLDDRMLTRFKNCGDADILLGHEESYRRTTPNFRYFIENPPLLGRIGLNPISE